MLKFNTDVCMAALRGEIKAAIILLQKEYLAEAKSHMLTPEGAESLELGDIEELANYFSAQVIGGAWAAMDNYGTGSLMDIDNPVIDDYKQSELWNPERHDNKIRTRHKGEYINIFGDKKITSSPLSGVDLEIRGGVYTPKPPSHAIETAMRWMDGRIIEVINNVVKNFNMARFIDTV